MTSDPRPRKTCKRYDTPGDVHELTFSCYKRRPFLSKDRTCHYLAQAIAMARTKHQFHLWAYVFMPEHVHLLIWPVLSEYSISTILKTIKQSVSRKAILVKCKRLVRIWEWPAAHRPGLVSGAMRHPQTSLWVAPRKAVPDGCGCHPPLRIRRGLR